MSNLTTNPNQELSFALLTVWGADLRAIKWAISEGADVNAPCSWTKNQRTPLHLAALKHDPSIAETLLEAGANPNLRNADGYTPLFLSVFNHNPEVAGVLLEATEPKAKTGKTDPRIYALDRMIAEKRANVNIIQDDCYGIMYCVRFYPHSEQPAFTRALLEAGLEVDRQTRYDTPLHIAARESANPEVIEILLHAGARANARNNYGQTPLHHAAGRTGNPEVLEALLEALLEGGADANARAEDYSTPLHHAAGQTGKPGVLEALLTAKADVNAKDRKGLTPLSHAVLNCSGEPDVGLVKMLIKHGADVNTKDRDGETPLHFSTICDLPAGAVTRWLIYANADPNARDHRGKTPLHHAAEQNRNLDLGVLEALLEGGADINAKDIHGKTPLELAINLDFAKRLLKYGADAKDADKALQDIPSLP